MNTTVSQGGTAAVFALAFVVALGGVLAHFNITMTTDVASALVTMLTILIHYLIAIHALPSVPAQPATAVEILNPTTGAVK